MTQMSLSRPDTLDPSRVSASRSTRLHLLVVAVTADDPTVAEAGTAVGVSMDPGRYGWLGLEPGSDPYDRFRPYDVVTVDALPRGTDQPVGSWRPIPHTLRVDHHLKQWRLRQRWLDRHVEDSMCRLDEKVAPRSIRRPLALIRVREVAGLDLERHPGWTDQHPRSGTPRFLGAYRYRCPELDCPGHRQSIVDAEFVAFQHRLAGLPDDRLRQALLTTFLGRMCGLDRDTAFCVGRRENGYRVLGTYWPPKW